MKNVLGPIFVFLGCISALSGAQTQNGEESRPRDAEPARVAAAADAAQNPTWTDPATGLMWTAKDNGFELDQPQAVAYCAKLQYAGLGGWRLPSLEQLQGIYDPDNNSRKQVVSNITYDVHVKNGLNLTTGWVWSDRPGDNPGKPYQNAWLFQFFDPDVNPDKGAPHSTFLHFKFQMRALCVRRPDVDAAPVK